MSTEEFSALYNTFNHQLCAFICGRIPDERDAEDILQEVLLRVHARMGTLRDENKLVSWLYQIARHAIADYYRRSRPNLVELDEALPDEATDEDSPEEENAVARLAPSLRELVDALPERYREALLLTEYQGLTQKELSERLGLSFSGAKSRVQRARSKIKDMLMQCCHFELDRRGMIMDYYEHCCCCAEK
jgi:RNA polymerase sigma-70 factor (ECF subfamily)